MEAPVATPSQAPPVSSPADPAGQARRSFARALDHRVAAVTGLAAAGVIFLRNAWMGDDAYVTLRAVYNLLEGYGLRWNVAERVQAFTNPLWALTLAVPCWFTGEMFYTTLLLAIALSLLAMHRLVFHITPNAAAAVFGVTALLFSKAFVDYGSTGLENALGYAVLIAFWARYLREDTGAARVGALVFWASLAVVNRLDHVMYVAPAIGYEVWRARRNPPALRAAALGSLPFLAWELFAIAYYGFPFPNTYYAKLHTGIPQSEYTLQGLRYVVNFAASDPVGFGVVLTALALTPFVPLRNFYLPALGLVLHSLYVIRVGGDFMTGRFFSATVLGSVVLLSRLEIWNRSGRALIPIAAVLILGLANPNAPVFSSATYHKDGWNDAGIADERGFYFPHLGLIALSRNIPRAPSGLSPVEVGLADMVGYKVWTKGPSFHAIDPFALTDPLLARLPAAYDPKWRIGHFRRRIPHGYLYSAASDRSGLTDPKLREFHDKILLITRGHIWSWERWKAIVGMNLGWYDSHVDSRTFRYGTRWIEASRLSKIVPDGSPWDLPGSVVLDGEGALVELSRVYEASHLDISLDAGDRYRIVFLDGDREVGQVDAEPVGGHGLRSRLLRVPRGARRRGFDTVYVHPVDGDGHYSIGHLVPIEE